MGLTDLARRLRSLLPTDLPGGAHLVPELGPATGLVQWWESWPRLQVRGEGPGRWAWVLAVPMGEVLDSGHADTWAEAMAVGRAALEVALVPAGARHTWAAPTGEQTVAPTTQVGARRDGDPRGVERRTGRHP